MGEAGYGEWAVVAIAAGLGLGVAVLLVRILGHTFERASETTGYRGTLILSLSLLTMLAMVGALITDRESAWTVVATGFGALAGSLQGLFEHAKDGEHGDGL